MRLPSASILSAIALSTVAMGRRTMTVSNECSFTIWPALFTSNTDTGASAPNFVTGWEAPAFSSASFEVPGNWQAGRIWGRRDCDFSNNPGPNSCIDGGCNGGLKCDKTTGTGVPPSTLAQFTLGGDNGDDFYEVSVVDGFNLPMEITNTAGCPVASCPKDLNPDCPTGLKGPFDSSGYPVGCKSDCEVDPNPRNSSSCCTGSFSTPEACPSSGVPHYSFFKSRCPYSSVYAFDESNRVDSSGTALRTCPVSFKANYTVTFCPRAHVQW